MFPLLVVACFLSGILVVVALSMCGSDILRGMRHRRAVRREHKVAEITGQAIKVDLDSASRSHAGSNVDLLTKFRRFIVQSGLDLTPSLLILISLFVAAVPALLVYLLTERLLLAMPVGLLFCVLPTLWVAYSRQRRCNRLREQLPDALDLMSRMLRAGQSIPQALLGVADEFEAPIADEFGYCYEQQNLGLSTDAAMEEMARRTGVLELKILVVALTVHRQSGGNLSELLDNLASVIRDRYRIYGQIRALTADGRMQAAILLALPPFLLFVLSAVNADYVQILMQYPWLLAGMFGFELVGALWLHRIVAFDF